MQLSSAVAAGADQRDIVASLREAKFVPQMVTQPIDEAGLLLKQVEHRSPGAKLGIQCLPRLGHHVSAGGGFGSPKGCRVGQPLSGAESHDCRVVAKSSSRRAVNTSQPVAVTSSVCSHCADSLPSAVRTVHPS